MKAPDYEKKNEKKRKSMCFKKNQKKMLIYAWKQKKKRDQDDEVSLSYSVYYSRQGLLILKILRMSFEWIDSHTTHESNMRWGWLFN